MMGTFFDISKAFDTVWYVGLIFKLKTYGVEGNLLKLLENYLTDRQQRVVLNGQTSSWQTFADDTSLFSKVIDKNNSNSQLNSDLAKISKWAFQWKMSFNPDPNKQAIEVCFSNKRDKENYPPLQFNNTNVQMADSQKHLDLILDSKLKFKEHIENKITKCNKIIGLMKKLL